MLEINIVYIKLAFCRTDKCGFSWPKGRWKKNHITVLINSNRLYPYTSSWCLQWLNIRSWTNSSLAVQNPFPKQWNPVTAVPQAVLSITETVRTQYLNYKPQYMLQRMAFYTMQYTNGLYIEPESTSQHWSKQKTKTAHAKNEISYLKIYSFQWLAFLFLLILWKLCYTHVLIKIEILTVTTF